MNDETTIPCEAESVYVDESIAIAECVPTEDLCESIETEEGVDTTPSDEQNTIQQLQMTITTLKEQISVLERARESQEKMIAEFSDFTSLFPEVNVSCIPENVWESVKNGTSLAAAYALYEKRAEAERLKIEKINSINSARSAGVAGKNTANEFFTPDDVRKMSRAEVHANFSKIKNSMKKWN